MWGLVLKPEKLVVKGFGTPQPSDYSSKLKEGLEFFLIVIGDQEGNQSPDNADFGLEN